MTDLATFTVEWTGDRPPFAKAFVAAQKAMEAVKKGSDNPGFKSKYADLAECVAAVLPALNANGIGVLQFPSFNGEVVAVTTTLLHESGSDVTGTLHLRPSKLDPQGVGSAITYGRRYSILAMTGVAPEDDDGNAASGPRQTPANAPVEAPKAPSLSDRATRLKATLMAVTTAADLTKAFRLASGLCAELDAKDPEQLADVTSLYENRLAQFEQVAA